MTIISLNPFGLPECVAHISSFLDGKDRINFDRTCQQYYDQSTNIYAAARKLIEYVANRPRIPKEVNVPIGGMTYERESELRVGEFYALFKKRMNELHSDSLNCGYARRVIDQLFPSLSKDCKNLSLQFEKIFIEDSAEIYAAQNLEKISTTSFEDQVQKIGSFLNNSDTFSIQTMLRQAIKRNHSSIEIDAIKEEFGNQSRVTPRLLAAQKRIENELTLEREGLLKELDGLRGPNHSDGAIDAAYREILRAKKELERYAHMDFQQTFSAALADEDPASTFLQLKEASERILNTLLEVFHAEVEMLKSTIELYNCLRSRMTSIAEFDQAGQIIGGRIHEINTTLNPNAIEELARIAVRNESRFYAEINRPVDEGNRVERLVALHAMFDII